MAKLTVSAGGGGEASHNTVSNNVLSGGTGVYCDTDSSYNTCTGNDYIKCTYGFVDHGTGAVDTNSKPLSIGRSGFGSGYFAGIIDEVKIWNRALVLMK